MLDAAPHALTCQGTAISSEQKNLFFRPIPNPIRRTVCLTAHTVSLKSAVRVHLRLSDRDVSVPPPVCIACLLAARPFLHLVADGSPSAHAFRVFLSNLSFSSPLLALLSAGEGKRERGPALPSFKAESYCRRLR